MYVETVKSSGNIHLCRVKGRGLFARRVYVVGVKKGKWLSFEENKFMGWSTAWLYYRYMIACADREPQVIRGYAWR